MKKPFPFIPAVLMAEGILQNAPAQRATSAKEFHAWWNDRPAGRPCRQVNKWAVLFREIPK